MTNIDYVEKWVVPKDLKTKDTSTYVPSDFLGNDGIEMNTDEQLKRLKKWKNSYLNVFKDLRNDPEINTLCLGENYLHNNYYPTPDAEIYASMMLDTVPDNIIEIGGGFSTIIAKKIISKFGLNCKITVIDPEPRTEIKDFADDIIYNNIEDVELNNIPIKKNSLIFIDSSHITRSRGDIPYIYNKLLPILPFGCIVHIHDIFIPYDYPFQYQAKLYTEQYMLYALLSHSKKYEIIFATHYMVRKHKERIQEVFGDVVGENDLYYGSSFWSAVK